MYTDGANMVFRMTPSFCHLFHMVTKYTRREVRIALLFMLCDAVATVVATRQMHNPKLLHCEATSLNGCHHNIAVREKYSFGSNIMRLVEQVSKGMLNISG